MKTTGPQKHGNLIIKVANLEPFIKVVNLESFIKVENLESF